MADAAIEAGAEVIKRKYIVEDEYSAIAIDSTRER